MCCVCDVWGDAIFSTSTVHTDLQSISRSYRKLLLFFCGQLNLGGGGGGGGRASMLSLQKHKDLMSRIFQKSSNFLFDY